MVVCLIDQKKSRSSRETGYAVSKLEAEPNHSRALELASFLVIWALKQHPRPFETPMREQGVVCSTLRLSFDGESHGIFGIVYTIDCLTVIAAIQPVLSSSKKENAENEMVA